MFKKMRLSRYRKRSLESSRRSTQPLVVLLEKEIHMYRRHSLSAIAFAMTCVALMSGCSTIAEKTNFISDEQIKSKVGGTLGAAPDAVTILNRRTSGTDTYVDVRVKGKQDYSCTLNGGNLLTALIVNPPSCNPKS
jgi:hypothetical protein